MYRIDPFREEIARDDGIKIRMNTRAPGDQRLAGWGPGTRGDISLSQHGAYRSGSDPKSELLQLPDCASVPPTRVALPYPLKKVTQGISIRGRPGRLARLRPRQRFSHFL